MDNKRKETRTNVNYEACYIGFANGSTPDRIAPCEILNISRNGIRISSVIPASEDHVVVSFSDQNKKPQFITGEVRYCQYQDYDSRSDSNKFNIGIKFLDPVRNIKDFITTLVKCSSKVKIERSFCLEQSQLVSDKLKKETKKEILKEKDPFFDEDIENFMEDITEKDLEISMKDPETESAAQSTPAPVSQSTGSERDDHKTPENKQITAGLYRQRKQPPPKKTSGLSSSTKVLGSVLLLLIIGYSLLFFIPEDTRSHIPVINKIPVELPSLDRVWNLVPGK